MSDLVFKINTADGADGAWFRLAVNGCVWPDGTGATKEMLAIHSGGTIKVIGGELVNQGTLVLNCTTNGADIFHWNGRTSASGSGETLVNIDATGRGHFNFVELSSGGSGTPVAAGGVALPVVETPLINPTVGLMYVHDRGGTPHRYQLRVYNSSSSWNVYTLSP